MMANIPHVDAELPTYDQHVNARADPQVAHSFRLMKSGHPFLEVVLHAGTESAETIPVLRQRQTLAGTVTLDLIEGMHIRCVSVQVIGELTKEYTVHRFLSMYQDLHPEVRGATGQQASGYSESVNSAKRKRWMTGRHAWPYSIKLPKGVSIPCDGNRKNYRLPPSFMDPLSKFSIEYRMKIRVKTGFFGTGYKLVCPFSYLPLLRPPLPSALCQQAQIEGVIPPGPDNDPDGWKVLRGVEITGTLFSSRRVEVTCTLSIPLPLAYTRGVAVPIYLVISSTDNQALNLLSSAHAPRVGLTRTMTFTPWQGIGGGGINEPPERHIEQIASVSFALPPGGGEESATSRTLCGQMVVPECLIPEFRILNYTLEYSIAIYPFEAVGFSSGVHFQKPLLQQNVQIVTAHAAVSFHPTAAPPLYSTANTLECGASERASPGVARQ